MSFFNEKIHVRFEDMLMGFSDALNLVDQRLTDHHKQVAYICYEISTHLNKDPEFTKEVVMLALVHDMGAFREEERGRLLSFEVENVMDHAVTGYLLLRQIGIYEKNAEAILYHHTHYRQGLNFKGVNKRIAMMAQILFLADRVSVLALTSHKNVLASVMDMIKTIDSESGKLFNPDYVTALHQLQNYDYFWLNIMTDNKDRVIRDIIKGKDTCMTYKMFKDFTKMFVYSIDFRSRYTATHSRGVAAVARAMANLYGLDEGHAQMMELAGYYHDIGKLMVPYEILDKPGPLSKDEYNLIKQHPYYTKYILDHIKGMGYISEISSSHHEMVDGQGYPYRLDAKALSLEAKLLTVADIFTALTENRPYRTQASNEEIKKLFGQLVKQGKLEQELAGIAINYSSELHRLNNQVQKEIVETFETIEREREDMIKQLTMDTASGF